MPQRHLGRVGKNQELHVNEVITYQNRVSKRYALNRVDKEHGRKPRFCKGMDMGQVRTEYYPSQNYLYLFAARIITDETGVHSFLMISPQVFVCTCKDNGCGLLRPGQPGSTFKMLSGCTARSIASHQSLREGCDELRHPLEILSGILT